MQTPAGKECSYYYADYFRGKSKQECRLLGESLPPLKWKPSLCTSCPVPGILLANACEHMVLKPRLVREFPFIHQTISVSAYCTKTSKQVTEPHIGCGECHPLPFSYQGNNIEPDITG